MNASVPGFDSKAARLRQRSFTAAAAATAAAALAASIAVCSVGLSAARASGSEPMVDRHDFLNGAASNNRPSSSSNPELEKLFWMCDFGASVGDLDAGQAEWCSVVTTHLQRLQFNGDTDAFSAWRQRNQAMAYEQLVAGRFELSCQQAASQTESRS